MPFPKRMMLSAMWVLVFLVFGNAVVIGGQPAVGLPEQIANRQVTTIVGNGQDGYGGPEGLAVGIAISQPFGLVIGPDQALYVCEVGTHVIRRVDLSSGHSQVVAGCGRQGYAGDGGPATDALLNEPYEVRFDKQGNMFFVEMMNHLVRRVDARTGVISTVAGCGEMGFSGDGGPATQARMSRPHSIAFDADGMLYVCDIGNHRIRRIHPETNIISTFAGTGERSQTPDGAPIAGTALNGPRALDFDGRHNLYLALREGNAIFRMDLRTSTIHHLAGTGKSGYAGDGGPAVNALLAGPKGISVAGNGDIYFADTESHTIRVIRPATADRVAIVKTVVGDGRQGNGPPGNPLSCRLDRPHGVFVSAEGILYIGDSSNHQVRRL